MLMKKHFWGSTAAFFGAWESLAFATKGRVPTVSAICWHMLGTKKGKPLAQVLIAAYLLGLGRHLLNGNKPV